jgi:hypothetical protein
VTGAADFGGLETLDDLTGDVVTIPCEEVIRRAGGETVVEGPVATEAAMAVAQEHPELVLAKLEDWGYGWS